MVQPSSTELRARTLILTANGLQTVTIEELALAYICCLHQEGGSLWQSGRVAIKGSNPFLHPNKINSTCLPEP